MNANQTTADRPVNRDPWLSAQGRYPTAWRLGGDLLSCEARSGKAQTTAANVVDEPAIQWLAYPDAAIREPSWGPFGDHAPCAMVNDLHVCTRDACCVSPGRRMVTCGNAFPLLPGGQVVAGSNPVSPTKVLAGEGRFRRNPKPPFLRSETLAPQHIPQPGFHCTNSWR